MLINTTVLVFCVGSFWFCRGSPKESCYQPIFYSSQALKKDTLEQPESPGQVGRLSSPLPRQKPPQTKLGIVHSAHYLFPALNFAIVPPDPSVQSVWGTLVTLHWHHHWQASECGNCSEGRDAPKIIGLFSWSLSQWQCFSACVCVWGCYSAVFLESHLSQEYKIRQAKQTRIICFPKDQAFSEALAVPLSYRIYYCKDHKVPWNTCRILGGC